MLIYIKILLKGEKLKFLDENWHKGRKNVLYSLKSAEFNLREHLILYKFEHLLYTDFENLSNSEVRGSVCVAVSSSQCVSDNYKIWITWKISKSIGHVRAMRIP